MSWIYLFIAGIFEIVWAVTLKYADGFSNWFYRQLPAFFYSLPRGSLKTATVA